VVFKLVGATPKPLYLSAAIAMKIGTGLPSYNPYGALLFVLEATNRIALRCSLVAETGQFSPANTIVASVLLTLRYGWSHARFAADVAKPTRAFQS
jgi:hypothetical protein